MKEQIQQIIDTYIGKIYKYSGNAESEVCYLEGIELQDGGRTLNLFFTDGTVLPPDIAKMSMKFVGDMPPNQEVIQNYKLFNVAEKFNLIEQPQEKETIYIESSTTEKNIIEPPKPTEIKLSDNPLYSLLTNLKRTDNVNINIPFDITIPKKELLEMISENYEGNTDDIVDYYISEIKHEDFVSFCRKGLKQYIHNK